MRRSVISVPLIIVASCLLDNRGLLAEDSPSVLVKYMKPAASKEQWADLPAWMSGVTIYSQPDTSQKRPDGVSGREVIFDVLKPTTVLVLASWAYDGNSSGGWHEDRSSLEALAKQGWHSIGKVQRRRKPESPLEAFDILRRDCRAGESFRFHTRKYNPPFVAMLPANRQSQIPVSKSADNPASGSGNKPDSSFASLPVRIKCMKPAENTDAWIDLPDWMKDATIYSQVDKSQQREEGVSGREVLFEVLRPTTVIVLASWVEQGNRGGGWFEDRSGLSDLKKLGWRRIGETKHQTSGGSKDLHQILRKDCKAGETFRFHTRKYTPPFVAILPDNRLAAIPGGVSTSDAGKPKMVKNEPTKTAPTAGTSKPKASPPKREVKPPSTPKAAVTAQNTAEVRVKFMKPVIGDKTWVDTPEWMKGATIFSESDRSAKRPEGVSGREVLFDVKKDSTILLLVSWTVEGSRYDEWTANLWSIDRLIEAGWAPLRKIRRQKKGDNFDEFIIFRRECKAGQSFRLHTRKYTPPFVAIASPERLASIPTSSPTLSAACILPPFPEGKSGRWKNDKAAARTVLLKAHDPEPDEIVGFGGMLQRELIRQAILLAAREELGLSTRDSMLREEFPNDSEGRSPLDVIVAGTTTRRLKTTIFRAGKTDWEILWNDRLRLDDDGPVLDQILEHAEKLSRTEFPAMLLQAGYVKGTATIRGDAKLDDETLDLLDTFQTVAQFGAVRHLHHQIRKSGESPELLSGLARAYANLGVLTEPLWSPAEKVFKARALLYAQRAIQQSPKTAAPYVARAYVWLLCGVHQFALDSLEAAAKLDSENTEIDSDEISPALSVVLAAAAKSDMQKLEELSADRKFRPLIRLLQFQAIEPTSQTTMLKRSSDAFLKEQPFSLRSHCRFLYYRQMGPRADAIHDSFIQFPKGLYSTLELVPDMPEVLLERVEHELPSFEDGYDIAEIDVRRRVIRDLKEIGGVDRDFHEPSMATLGQLIHEFGFLQSAASLYYQRYAQGVQVDGSIPTFRQIVAGHPYADYIESFASDPARQRQTLEQLVARIDPAGLNASTKTMIDEIWRSYDKQPYKKLVRNLNLHHDETLRDIYKQILALDETRSAKLIATRLKQIQELCPNHPITAALTARFDRDQARPHLASWEERFADHTLVLYWVAENYEKAGDNEGWERCLQQGLKVVPDADSYQRLAGMYDTLGKKEMWKSTLDEMLLKTESDGLDHARARSNIAWYLMRQQKFKEAFPYAQASADSYSGWSLHCLSVCLEGLGRLEDSENVLRAMVYRYDNNGLMWLQWCARNGQGDKETARRATLKDISSYPKERSADQLSILADYYLLTGDATEALVNFEKYWQKERGFKIGGMAAALADELGKTDLRDRLLQGIMDRKSKLAASSLEGPFCDLMKVVKDGLREGVIDVKRSEEIIDKADSTVRPMFSYFLARFLHNQKQKEDAIRLMTYAATSPNIEYVRGHAMTWLREKKIPFGKPRELESSSEADEADDSK